MNENASLTHPESAPAAAPATSSGKCLSSTP